MWKKGPVIFPTRQARTLVWPGCRQKGPERKRRGHCHSSEGTAQGQAGARQVVTNQEYSLMQAKQETWNRKVGQNQIKTVWHKQGGLEVPQTGSPLFSQMEQEATPESQGKASLRPKDSKCPLCLSRGRFSSRILSRNDNTAVLRDTMSLCPGLIRGLYLWCSCHYSPHLQMKNWRFPEAHLPVVTQPVSDSARRWETSLVASCLPHREGTFEAVVSRPFPFVDLPPT